MNNNVLAVVVTTEPPSPSIIEPLTRSTSANVCFVIILKQKTYTNSASSRVVLL